MRRSLIFYRNEIQKMTGKVSPLKSACQVVTDGFGLEQGLVISGVAADCPAQGCLLPCVQKRSCSKPVSEAMVSTARPSSAKQPVLLCSALTLVHALSQWQNGLRFVAGQVWPGLAQTPTGFLEEFTGSPGQMRAYVGCNAAHTLPGSSERPCSRCLKWLRLNSAFLCQRGMNTAHEPWLSICRVLPEGCLTFCARNSSQGLDWDKSRI